MTTVCEQKVKTCYFCGHRGTDVTKYYYVHIGGQGEVPYPICEDTQACIKRVEKGDK